MGNINNEFYAIIGELSIAFAKMEYNIQKIISRLINSDDELISVYLIEKNNLQKNMDILRNLNKVQGFEEETMHNILSRIDKIKRNRNLFIHGIWKDPLLNKDNVKIAICEERKIKYIKTVSSRTWQYNKHYLFTFEELKKQTISVKRTIEEQDEILNLLEYETFQG